MAKRKIKIDMPIPEEVRHSSSTMTPHDNSTDVIYSPNGRKKLMDRIVLNIAMQVNRGSYKSISILEQPRDTMRVNPPYGILPVAMSASIPELQDMIRICDLKKNDEAKRGHFAESRQWGWRQNILQGVLTGAITFGLG